MSSYIGIEKEMWKAFRGHERNGPIHMLNLVKLRDVALYDDGREASGAEAYAAYGQTSHAVFERVGGRIVWRGAMEVMLIGPPEKTWDICFIAEYPSVDAFVDMQRDPEYQAAVPHRQAGVLDSRLIRMNPLAGGGGFG